jgi:hypothetical protein
LGRRYRARPQGLRWSGVGAAGGRAFKALSRSMLSAGQ